MSPKAQSSNPLAAAGLESPTSCASQSSASGSPPVCSMLFIPLPFLDWPCLGFPAVGFPFPLDLSCPDLPFPSFSLFFWSSRCPTFCSDRSLASAIETALGLVAFALAIRAFLTFSFLALAKAADIHWIVRSSVRIMWLRVVHLDPIPCAVFHRGLNLAQHRVKGAKSVTVEYQIAFKFCNGSITLILMSSAKVGRLPEESFLRW